MLNISDNSISHLLDVERFKACNLLRKKRIPNLTLRLLFALLVGSLITLFLPWTQNITSKGYVTTRSPEQRPQAIHSVIAGRLEKWYVQEGDYVNAGDTIVFISEVKSEYFDPDLIMRTKEQLAAKAQSIESYDQKISALQNQFSALQETFNIKTQQNRLKINQTKNKIKMDSIDLVAFKTNLKIAENQLKRTRELYDQGLKTLSEMQEKELKVQSDRAKVNVQENKLTNQKNELITLTIEISAIKQNFADKLSKSQSEQQSAISAKMETIAQLSKLQNQLSNYQARKNMYFITSPQSGYITKTITKGIGETIKEGADIATIMPSEYDLAVEVYLKPQDLPLISIGNKAALRFDGWPAIVISGWPESATGVFYGNVVAVDRFIGDNGLYRVLLSPTGDKEWPVELRVGTGVQGFLLLKNVPLWYELWRKLNGFPADYYQSDDKKKEDVKRKAPLKSVK